MGYTYNILHGLDNIFMLFYIAKKIHQLEIDLNSYVKMETK